MQPLDAKPIDSDAFAALVEDLRTLSQPFGGLMDRSAREAIAGADLVVAHDLLTDDLFLVVGHDVLADVADEDNLHTVVLAFPGIVGEAVHQLMALILHVKGVRFSAADDEPADCKAIRKWLVMLEPPYTRSDN